MSGSIPLDKILKALELASTKGSLEIEEFIEDDDVVHGVDKSGGIIMTMSKKTFENMRKGVNNDG